MKYKLTKKALEDIENIWTFTAKTWSRDQADYYYNLVLEEIEFLARNPDSGKKLTGFQHEYWSSRVKSHLIFNRKENESSGIAVIRILHRRMDIENRLGEK